MKNTNWSIADIPSQSGRLAIVTGTGGLGYETALAMAQAGAEVILAGRNETKGLQAVAIIQELHPDARIAFEKLDVASLASIADFARRFADVHSDLDLLVNNAGVMSPKTRRATADGFELQFGTNYLGHFALTAHLLPYLLRGRAPRVVQVSSLAHRQGSILFDNLQGESGYHPWTFYCQSKLAMLLFALELQRRSDSSGWGLISNAAHPGFARTDLVSNGPGDHSLISRLNRLLQPFLSQSAAAGALPTLYAATAPEAKGGEYYGPNGFYEMKGPPAPAYIAPRARDLASAQKLWDISEQVTGVSFPSLAPAA
ncbi:MAG TPA: SDR family oxidoreductase [Candidatus Methylacidiphilales bacterium]